MGPARALTSPAKSDLHAIFFDQRDLVAGLGRPGRGGRVKSLALSRRAVLPAIHSGPSTTPARLQTHVVSPIG